MVNLISIPIIRDLDQPVGPIVLSLSLSVCVCLASGECVAAAAFGMFAKLWFNYALNDDLPSARCSKARVVCNGGLVDCVE